MNSKICDNLYLNRERCENYVKEEDKPCKILVKDEDIISDFLSNYHPEKDKVHVALGVGGGRDFLVARHKSVKRKIGVDYSPHMLELCGRKYKDAELILDDITSLKVLKESLKEEKRSVFYTLLTNTLGNLEENDRKKSIESIRECMNSGDLLVLELYRRIEELKGAPKNLEKIKLGSILYEDDLLKNMRSKLPKKATLADYLKAFGLPEPYLHSLAQQNEYSELSFFNSIKHVHSEYNPDTHDVIVSEVVDGDFFNRKPVFLSHRWSYNEIKNSFTSREMEIDVIPTEKTYFCTAWKI